MPTPVIIAKQCLNQEASHALDEAVSVARRRGHVQTTSLHAVSALLSLSSSQLREACVRARNAAFYPRVQLKALELCLSGSLDRSPTSQVRVDEPPVSNSLMAAIKRSQANQRRQPESLITVKNQNHNLGQSQEQVGINTSGVIKVELQHLIVSILDDPIVSRVFNDAGFRSFDVKLALLRPMHNFFRYPPRFKGHQGVFLGDLDGYMDPGYRPFRFPFSGYGGSLDCHEDYRRIGEVLVRKKGGNRNPLLVGVCANDALRGFLEVLERKNEMNVLPLDVHGVEVVSIEKDVLKFVSENWSDEAMSLRFKELDLMVENCLGPGVMISLGDLRCFVGVENGLRMDVRNFVVRKLTKLLEVHGVRVWLIGAAANDQIYMEFLSKFPLINKDWDLQVMPITSVKPLVGESCFKSSLMGSFVPFGGFFSSSSDLKAPFSSTYQQATHGNLCNEKVEQEVVAFSKRGFIPSATAQHQSVLSPWPQMAQLGMNNTLDDLKAKGGTMLLSPTVAGLQKNWDDICEHPHHTQSSAKPENVHECFQLPTSASFLQLEEKVKNVNKESSSTANSACKECDYGSMDILKYSTTGSSNPALMKKNENFHAKLLESPKTECPLPSGSWTPCNLCLSFGDDCQNSPSSGVSAATDLELELFSQPSKQRRKAHAIVDNKSLMAKCVNHASFNFSGESDANNFKTLFKALYGKVGRQCEAVRRISQIVVHSWTSDGRLQRSSRREDIWLNFIGSDTFGKRKTALALAEILYGSKNNFLYVDLCSEEGVLRQRNGFASGSDFRYRGKTIVDHIAEELLKKPSCVVFLENVQSADPPARHSLLQAIRNGRFSDSRGREVAVKNRIFVLTLKRIEDTSTFSFEERIVRGKGCPLQILVKGVENDTSIQNSALIKTGENTPKQIILNKGKLNGADEKSQQCIGTNHSKRLNTGLSKSLDLNLPAETSEDDGTNTEDIDSGCGCERFDSWLEEFSGQVDKIVAKVVFEPLDYDALVTKVSRLVHESFHKIVGSKGMLEIEPRAMNQMLAASCLSDGDKEVEEWIEQVLSKGFAEAQRRYQLTTHTVVIVATCGALYAEGKEPEARLPSEIILR